MALDFDIRVPEECFTRLCEMRMLFPKEMRRAQKLAARNMAVKIGKAVAGGGDSDTGRLSPLSELRLKLDPKKPFGGVFKQRRASLFKTWQVGNVQYAGAITNVAPFFSRFQEGGNRDIPKASRHMMHKRLGGMYKQAAPDVPKVAIQPQRQVISPLVRYAEREYSRNVVGIFNKLVERKLGKVGG